MISNHSTHAASRKDAVQQGTLRVDMIADLVCPWSYLGKRRLDVALAAVHGPRLLRWLPFQLNPDMPDAGMDFDEYLVNKFGSRDAVQPGLDELTRAGKDAGVHFAFDRLKRMPNTIDAHRLLAHATQEGADTAALGEDILASFFEQGCNIGDQEVLLELGYRRGLSRAGILGNFADERSRERVLQQEKDIRRGGITGVPDFLVNDRLMVLGAQPVAVLVDAFDRVMFGDESDQPVSGSLH